MKKLLIFDLDGTLFDTRDAMAACGNHALSVLGFSPLRREDYARFSGRSVEGFVQLILEAAGDPEHRENERFWKEYLSEQERLPEGINRPFPGIPELLRDAKKSGMLLAALSNKDHATCVDVIEKAFGKGAFDCIRGEQSGTPPKPDPAGLFEILNELSLTVRDAVYVGDTEVDLETGERAGMDTVGALWGYRTREDLSPYRTAKLVESPGEILPLLAR